MNGQDAAAGRWQTVKGKQQDARKKRAPEPVVAPSQRIETNDSVFSALDNWYDRKQRQTASHQKPAEGFDSSETNGRAHASSASDDGSSSATESNVQKAPDVPPRTKKPKAKRAKVTPSQAASGLDSKKITDLLSSVQQTYPDNELSQLQTLGDHLLTTFQTSELPFNKLLNEQYLDKVCLHMQIGFEWICSDTEAAFVGVPGHRHSSTRSVPGGQTHTGKLCCSFGHPCSLSVHHEHSCCCPGDSP